MAVTLYSTATEYLANELTILRGTVADITAVGVFHSLDPNTVPPVASFDIVALVDGTAEPPGANSEAGKIDVLSLIGPKAGADLVLAAGDWQRFVLVQTASEDIIRKVDVIEVL